MELDDLRRQWQRPEPVAPLGPTELTAWLKGRPLGPVERMHRNAWVEAALNVLVGLAAAVALPLVAGSLLQLLLGLLLLLALGLVGFFYRLLHVLRQMLEPAGSVRAHLATLAQGLRHLLRFYYRLTVATGPLTMALLWGGELWHMGQRGLFAHWGRATVVAGLFLVLAVALQLGIVRFARWYVQRLYGRHLDRLEGQLRELSEGEPVA